MGELIDSEMPVYAVDKYSRYGDFILMFVKTYNAALYSILFKNYCLIFVLLGHSSMPR